MADNTEDKLRKFVNSSGFPLQIGIKHAVETSVMKDVNGQAKRDQVRPYKRGPLG